MHRPVHSIGRSPRMPAHRPSRGTDSSSSSSSASSPIQSPRTYLGSAADSPLKEPLNLPPPAFPSHQSLGFPGSIPVKIPKLSAKSTATNTPSSQTPGSHSASLFPIGNSIDTLKFGRRPGAINSITSPNALAARCACGKVAGHAQRRASSKERVELGLGGLSLGPSILHPTPHGARVASNPIAKHSQTGHNTPNRNAAMSADLEHHTISSTLNASLLSRSRSDPIPPSLQAYQSSLIAPMTRPDGTLAAKDSVPAPSSGHGLGRPGRGERVAMSSRGRSLERQPQKLELSQPGVLNQSREREQAPSRSRHRHDQRPDRHPAQEPSPLPNRPVFANAADANWARRPSAERISGEGIVPATRRPGQTGDRSPRGRPGYGVRADEP
jgi:hypothetical protein